MPILTRTTCLIIAAAASACAFGSSGPNDIAPLKVTVAKSIPAVPFIPKFGVRVGGGNWNEFMVNGGIDLTFNVPLLPIPAIRVDGEIWGKPGNFGSDRRGNAISILGIQTFLVGYAGVGPCYYFTDDLGSHQSGIGAKIMGGVNLPENLYVEACVILGPSNPPIFITVGRKF